MLSRTIGPSSRALSRITSLPASSRKPAAALSSTQQFTTVISSCNAPSVLRPQQQQQIHPYYFSAPSPLQFQYRSYISRAHPRPVLEYAFPTAVEMVQKKIEKRKKKTTKRWNRRSKKELTDRKDDGEPFRPQNETIELALNLNLDPRKPGQQLRGSILLPHGSGITVNCVVFSNDDKVVQAAKAAGALHAGGEGLIQDVVAGTVPVDSFQRALATPDILPTLSKNLARVLGPRGLMPNAKVGTVVQPDQMAEVLADQLSGKDIQYRTDKEGILHIRLGKGSFSVEEVLGNAAAVMHEVHAVKPETYGKTKKKKKGGGKAKTSGAKYVLSAFLTSSHTRGSVKIDLRTMDPGSAYFMKTVDDNEEDDNAQAAA